MVTPVVPGRVFVVGCPRSGTTLLQTMLGQHADVLTLPETHYLLKIRGRLAGGPLDGFASPRAARRALAAVEAAVDRTGPTTPRWGIRARAWERAFVDLLDAAASARDAALWVDKSPIHLHWIDEILAVAPDARFVHVLRDGRDVVASFHRLCLRDPERWVPQVLGRGSAHLVLTAGGRGRVLDAVVDRWNGDVGRSLAHLGTPGHTVVVYEYLVSDPEGVLRDLCTWLGIPFDPAMLRHWEAASRVVGHRAGAAHMRRTFGPLDAQHLRTFHDVLAPEERVRVTSRLLRGGRPLVSPDGQGEVPGRRPTTSVPRPP